MKKERYKEMEMVINSSTEKRKNAENKTAENIKNTENKTAENKTID